LLIAEQLEQVSLLLLLNGTFRAEQEIIDQELIDE
jgi:hypothetical protein